MNDSQNIAPKNSKRIFENYDAIKNDNKRILERIRNDIKILPINYSTSIIHGSSKWLTPDQIEFYGLASQGEGNKASPYLGYIPPKDSWGSFTYIFSRSPSASFYNNDELPDSNGHTLTIAPTRAGKGSGQIIPNLLLWKGSVIVLDIKGENYKNSAGYRAKILKQNVYTFALSGEGGNVFNPIMSIRANLNWTKSTFKDRCNEEEDVSFIENLLFTPSNSAEDSFWEGSAKSFIKGLLLHVRTAELLGNTNDPTAPSHHRVRERSMREVRRLICLDIDSFASLLEDMGESQRPLIREAGTNLKKLLTGDGKTGLSILATAQEQTKAWSYGRVHQATYKKSYNKNGEPAPNDFTFDQLRDGNTSIYLIVPPEHLAMYRPVLRVIVGCAIRELKDSHRKAKANTEGDEKPPVLFLLDEFPQLGYMQPIEDTMAYIAGYGVRMWLFIQDISQLKKHYKDSWQTFMANTETKCIFGVNDIETANWVSEMLGTTTIDDFTPTTGSSNTEQGYNKQYSTSSSTTHVPRRLMTPDEVMRMPKHEQIILINGLSPILCDRPGYYECNYLNERSKISFVKPVVRKEFRLAKRRITRCPAIAAEVEKLQDLVV